MSIVVAVRLCGKGQIARLNVFDAEWQHFYLSLIFSQITPGPLLGLQYMHGHVIDRVPGCFMESLIYSCTRGNSKALSPVTKSVGVTVVKQSDEIIL